MKENNHLLDNSKNSESILNKAFTLIELLAIIVILAIIAVITVPIILNMIDNSKKGAAIDSAHGYKDAVQKYYISNLLNNENGLLPNDTKLVSALPSDFEVSGEKPTNDSWVQLEQGQVVAYSLKFGDYTVTKYKDTDIICEKGNVKETEEIRLARLKAIDEADTYVKSALTKYASLQQADVKKVSEMSVDGLTTPENLAATGWIHFGYNSTDGLFITDYSLKFGDYVLDYSSLTDGNYISITSEGNERGKTKGIVATGSTKCFGEATQQECFKVIKTYTENSTSKAMLFANYNLKKYTDNTTNPATITYKQEDNSPDAVSFSSTNYWHNPETNELYDKYAKDINGDPASYTGNPYPYVYNLQGSDTNNVKPYVDGYLETLKTETYGLPSSATGRLLTNEEAMDTSIFADNNARSNGKSYWLGSANLNNQMRSVWGTYFNTPSQPNNAGSVVGTTYSMTAFKFGVRPVIIIPTSDL